MDNSTSTNASRADANTTDSPSDPDAIDKIRKKETVRITLKSTPGNETRSIPSAGPPPPKPGSRSIPLAAPPKPKQRSVPPDPKPPVPLQP